jgi:Flp pilus assembly protein TadG
MQKLFRDNRGGSVVEFSLLSLPVVVFLFGIMQTGWLLWADNLLNVAVDAAARCGGVGSTISPCNADLVTTAQQVFGPLSGASFSLNGSSCATNGGIGLVGTYTMNIAFAFNVTITAKSCYPNLTIIPPVS